MIKCIYKSNGELLNDQEFVNQVFKLRKWNVLKFFIEQEHFSDIKWAFEKNIAAPEGIANHEKFQEYIKNVASRPIIDGNERFSIGWCFD